MTRTVDRALAALFAVASTAGAGLACQADPLADPLAGLLDAIDRLTATKEGYVAATASIHAMRDAPTRALRVAIARSRARLVSAFDRSRGRLDRRDPFRSWHLHLEATSWVDWGHSDVALERLSALRLESASDRPRDLWIEKCLILRADLEHQSGRDEAALGTVRQVLRAAQSPPPSEDARSKATATAIHADALGIRGRVYSHMGVLDKAATDLREQLALARSCGDAVSLLRAHINRVELYLAQGRAERARRAIDDARREVEVRSAPQLDAMAGIAASILGVSDPEVDREAYVALRKLFEAGVLLSPSLRRRARLALVQVAMRQSDRATARAALAALRGGVASGSERGDLQVDVEVAASYLARTDPDCPAPERRAQLARSRTSFDSMLERWSAAPVRDDGIGFLAARHRRALLGEIYELSVLVEGEEQACRAAVDALLRVQALGTEARRSAVPPIGLDDLRRDLLPTAQAIVFLLAAQSGGRIFVVDAEKIHTWPLPEWTRTANAADSFLAVLRKSVRHIPAAERQDHAARLLQQGRRAADLLLPQGARRQLASYEAITVSDSGLLRQLPFECLVLEEGRLLGQEIAVNTLDSLPYGLQVLLPRVARAGPSADLGVFVRLASGGADADDAAAAVEAEAVAERLAKGWRRAAKTLSQDVTPELILRLKRPASVTQIVAHGTDDPSAPGGTAIVVAGSEDGRALLQAQAIREGAASGLVILSVCEAARAQLRVGDGRSVSTLGGAFLQAGAHTVVQSDVDLLLEPHVQLCEIVHRHLRAGLPAAVALQRARRELAATASAFTQFQHALVQCFGMGHMPLFEVAGPSSTGRSR